MNFCQAIIMGRLSTEVTLTWPPGGTARADFSIAYTRRFRRPGTDQVQEYTSFFKCQAWGAVAEQVHRHFDKGRPIMVIGELKQDRWEDSQTHERRYMVRVMVEQFKFIDSKPPQQHVSEQQQHMFGEDA
jgi:single-strand DNA-binding protein